MALANGMPSLNLFRHRSASNVRHIHTRKSTNTHRWFFSFADDQQHDLCDRSFSSSSGGHYCTHSSHDSSRPLISSMPAHPQAHDPNDAFKHSAPSSTGSSSHSSSGLGSSIESPYNHWKYLTPLSVTTASAQEATQFSSDKKPSSSKVIEPVSTTT